MGAKGFGFSVFLYRKTTQSLVLVVEIWQGAYATQLCSARLEGKNGAIFGTCIFGCAVMVVQCEDSDIACAKVQSRYFCCLAGTGCSFLWWCPEQCKLIWQMMKSRVIEKTVWFGFFFCTFAQTVTEFHVLCLVSTAFFLIHVCGVLYCMACILYCMHWEEVESTSAFLMLAWC